MTTHSERARQWVHIGSGGFALLLRVLTWQQAAFLAGVALAFNAFALPRLGGRQLYRPADHARGYPLGILLYPLSVLLTIGALRSRLDLAAAAWGIFAFGDGMATLVGERSRAHAEHAPSHAEHAENPAGTEISAGSADSAWFIRRLPWNRDKSVAGTIAFVTFGAVAGSMFALWTRPAIVAPSTPSFTVAAVAVAAVAAALVESLPVRLDDNISVPFTAAAVLWAASLVDVPAWSTSRAAVFATLPLATGFNAVIAYLGYRAKTVSASGMIGGAVVGIVIFACGGAAAWLLLFLTFAAATAASRVGMPRKTRLGIAENRHGRRGAANAFANCGVAAIASILAVATAFPAESLLALTAALTAGGSDTVASEIGKAWGRRTVLITSGHRVPPGTPGAISLEGTLAGVAAAVALAAIGASFGLVGRRAVIGIAAAATIGASVESILGATLEPAGILNNDMLNFINTAVAAAVVLWLG